MDHFKTHTASSGGRDRGHDDWKRTDISENTCDCCKKMPAALTVHQLCKVCGFVVCRDCVAKGEISNRGSHAAHEVGDFDWVDRYALLTQRAGGSRAPGQPSVAIAVPGGQANTPDASPTKGSSSAPKSSAKKMTQTTLNTTQNSTLALSTPTKAKNSSSATTRPSKKPKHSKKNKASKKKQKKGKKSYYNSDSDSDSDFDEMDSNAPSDKEYVPPAEAGGKGFVPAATADAGRAAPVGLAQSRPVRAAAINTYEKMRSGSGNVKKEELEVEEMKISEIPEAKGKLTEQATPAQDHGYAQQGQVQGGGAYLHAPQYGEGPRHLGLPQLHPGAENKRTAAAAEKAPAEKRQNASKMDSLTASMSSMSAVTVGVAKKAATPQKAKSSQKGKAPQVGQASQASQSQTSGQAQSTHTQSSNQGQSSNQAQSSGQVQSFQTVPLQQHTFPPQPIAPNINVEERNASRRIVTASLGDLLDAMQAKLKLHIRAAGLTQRQQCDIVLREMVHSAWVTNIVLTQMKRNNGELPAIAVLRGYAVAIMHNMKLGGCPLTINWIDGTEQAIQSVTADLSSVTQIDVVQPAFQPGLNYPINGEDVEGANTLTFMSAGGHGN
ncbi:hypothetical protein HER10_EVM0001694 [Colletotrichum scovillei]|uniref:Uncharacterized protein n=1 Tax=Colletotrichum scovillei TaxID=1209932 RepID=A0A9P7R7T0_9PEZI|nr:uncharacterized protein HER10_EVM0001694 [Colletotrichum scovillei]KAF4781665.1 hypothetical protein HER10_EVM0001694 [Colletotrichum scovillei]KAG7050843.1 hypothetical protein JMJ77_0013583 [Colletotrichum scovillei]KAG7069884.1 hypothetical protein JMJ76_0003544 [Colletotrichum scovillei]KAG7073843.1 hypothetical protein JMJ78_0014810 [Colletotrichum scovillei]